MFYFFKFLEVQILSFRQNSKSEYSDNYKIICIHHSTLIFLHCLFDFLFQCMTYNHWGEKRLVLTCCTTEISVLYFENYLISSGMVNDPPSVVWISVQHESYSTPFVVRRRVSRHRQPTRRTYSNWWKMWVGLLLFI